MYINNLYCGVAFAALIALSAAPAIAQQQNNGGQAVELETITVEGRQARTKGAQRGDQEPTVATQAETVLTERTTRQQLDAAQVSDPRDIDQLETGVSFSETSQSFNIRGLDRARVLTTVDGIRVPWIPDVADRSGNGTAFGGVSSFNFNTLSELDIVKGSDSTVFGGGGIGGVVALRTLEPEDLIEPGNTFGGITKFSLDSRDESWGADQALAARADNTFFLVQGGYREGHEIENQGTIDTNSTARTKKNPADYDQNNILVKLKQHVDGGHTFGLTGERFDRADLINKRNLSSATLAGSAFNEEGNQRDRISLHYDYNPEEGGGWLDGAQAVAYWMRQDLSNDYNSIRVFSPFAPAPMPTGPFSRTVDFDQTLFGVSGAGFKIIDTGAIEHRVSFGGELFGSRAEQYSGGFDNCPALPPAGSTCSFLHTNQADMPKVEGATLGLFVQDEIAFYGNTVRLTPGLRFDAYKETPKDTPAFEDNLLHSLIGVPEESSDENLAGKLRLEVDVANVTLFGQWAQGFRAPTAAELFQVYGGVDSYARIGNSDLKPETSNGFDLGILAGDADAGGAVKVFYNRYKNFIDDVAVSEASIGVPVGTFPDGVTQYINRANVQIYGAEFDAHLRHATGYHTWGRVGVYAGEDMDTNIGLNTIPAAKAVIGVGYAQDTWGADLIFTAAASRDFDTVPPPGPNPGSDVENLKSATPSYQTLDFTTWWSPRQIEGLTFRAGVYNIFDETYYPDALDAPGGVGGSSGPAKEYFTEGGRNFRVSGVYKF